MIRLIALDLDGTVLSFDLKLEGRYSKEHGPGIHEQKTGASGRKAYA